MLLIEDHSVSAKGLETRLKGIGQRLGIEVRVRPLVKDHCDDFIDVFKKWYPHGELSSDDVSFDVTSLDVIFKEGEVQNEANGGERLHAWLQENNLERYLGRVVVRSFSPGTYFNNKNVIRVPKATMQEISQWERIIQDSAH